MAVAGHRWQSPRRKARLTSGRTFGSHITPAGVDYGDNGFSNRGIFGCIMDRRWRLFNCPCANGDAADANGSGDGRGPIADVDRARGEYGRGAGTESGFHAAA